MSSRRSGLACHVFGLALARLCHRPRHFKAARGAAWALLASACMHPTLLCNVALSMALSSGAPLAPAALAAGLALLAASSFGIIGAGSALAHGQRCAALGGVRPESKLWRVATRTLGRATTGLFRDRERARAAAAATLLLAAAGWALALGGVAAVRAICSRDLDAMRAFRLPLYPYPGPDDNAIDCARAFTELWWAWEARGAAAEARGSEGENESEDEAEEREAAAGEADAKA
jgi:hypothetical protein